MPVRAACLGYPRIGIDRGLKKALESYWAGKLSAGQLEAAASALRRANWLSMRAAGIHHIPGNDFSLYDHILDMAVAVGAVPERYRRIEDLSPGIRVGPGLQDRAAGIDVPALDMTKWFDTNYHYIVPELEERQAFRLDPSKILSEVEEARSIGVEIRPVLPGPVTFLMLSRFGGGARGGRVPLDLLGALLPAYDELLAALAAGRRVGPDSSSRAWSSISTIGGIGTGLR
jgi:5-methyltetrahydropteroyltriglutamate--homocysteine methyltransferase